MLTEVATGALALPLTLCADHTGSAILAKIGALVDLASLAGEAIRTLALWGAR